ncbi:MAG: DeoR/GlpR transcriptional regulator [Ruminococcaceae bacterium]|nr:DeoR/GlpR transcriptional regulator [Oscillospiraceae bacterium]
MFAKERHEQIVSMLRKKRTVTTPELVQHFQVSIETIRRDLLTLEQKGLLQRVHGGAMMPGEMRVYTEYTQRMEENKKGKIELAHTAVSLVHEGEILCIDGSSATALYFAKVLRDAFNHLTIVTNGLDVFNELSHKDSFELFLCGGYFSHPEMAFHGHQTIETLRNLHVQKSFVCPSAISLHEGVCDFSHTMQSVQMQIMACGEEVIFLADSDKFEKRAMLKLCDMSPQHVYVTDSGIDAGILQLYKENDMQVIVK